MRKIIHLALFLAIISGIASFALFQVNEVTSPIIEKANTDAINLALKQLVPEADTFEEVIIEEDAINAVYLWNFNNEIQAVIYEIRVYGFQSELKALVAIDKEGNFINLQVVSQAETPGFGTQIVDNEVYLNQFKNNSIDNNIDVISGSTVTTAALNGAISEAVEHFNQNFK